MPGETPRDMMIRLASTAAAYNQDPTLQEDVFHCLWYGWIGGASPVSSNFGANRGYPISCFSVHINDSVSSIYSHLKEVAQLSKNGGGVGVYLGDVRPSGAPISGGGKSTGTVPWGRQYDLCASVVSQGGVRRGNFAMYIPIEHSDIYEWLRAKDHSKGDPRQMIDSNIAVTITDEWIESMIDGDKDKQKLFGEVLKTRMISGSPYIVFIDNANRQNPKCYVERGLSVKTSNLCFTGDTLVAVADGRNAVPISELEGSSFPVYSARPRVSSAGKPIKQWVPEIKQAVAYCTGEREVVEVELEDGSTFRCTPDHQLALRDTTWVEAQNSTGMVLEPFTSRVNGFGHREICCETGYRKQGRMIWEFHNGPVPQGHHVDHVISQGGDKIENLQVLTKEEHWIKTTEERRGESNPIHKVDKSFHSEYTKAAVTGRLNPKFSGIDNYELINLGKQVLERLGYFDKKAYLTLRDEGYNVPISFSNYRFNKNFEEYRSYVVGEREYDGKYESLPSPPVNPRKVALEEEKNKVKSIRRGGLRVVSVRSLGVERVYDLTVEDNNNFYIVTSRDSEVFSGVLVHNCSEIFLHTDEHHSFVCVLSSLNLSKYDEYKNWKSPTSGRTVPQIGIHFLEAVVSEFIRKAKDKVGMGRSVRFAEKSRALGLGVMGLHTLYQKRGLPFESKGARELNVEVHKWVREEAEVASRELAITFGEPEWCRGSGMRHTHLLAIAPTRTNSVISGAFSQGIEPIDRNYFVAKQAKGTYVRKNPVLEKLLCERGVGSEVWDQILEDKGSVRNLDCLTDEEKEIFKTAREINQFEIVKQAADRQPFICQGQSLNLFVDPEADAAYLMRLHLSAWKMGLKSLYYLKSSSLLTKKQPVQTASEEPKHIVITKGGCPWCVKLKDQLTKDGFKFKEVSVDEAKEMGKWDPDFKTVPQLYLWGALYEGGYNGYMKGRQNLLDSLMEPVHDTYAECAACEA